MAKEIELLGLYWTTSGPTEAHGGREWSLFDWADRCAEASKVGFAGLGIWHTDLEHILESRSHSEMKKIFDDAGLEYLELEFLMDWWIDEGTEDRKASDEQRKLLLDAAGALEAHHVKVGNIFGKPCEIPKLTERFGELCADAAQRTEAKIVYEFMPFDANVKDVDTAVEMVQGAGAANGGLVIDTWHMSKLGITPDDLRRIPLEYLSWIELSDGQVKDMDDPVMETTQHRRLPGEGEFEIRGYVEVCRELGYPGPWGVEVLSKALDELPMEEIFKRSYETSVSQFEPVAA
jgi:sugar phosphate isomerase/epimerase